MRNGFWQGEGERFDGRRKMSAASSIRVALHVIAILVLLGSLAFLTAGFMTTAWQVYEDPGTGEIHQHGLWLDFYYSNNHAASAYKDERRWMSKTKFGEAVYGDESHRARPYQVNTLILLAITALLVIVAAVCACASASSIVAGGIWVISTFLATLLTTAAILLFYMESLNNRFVQTDKKIEQVIGYSFWYTFVSDIGFAISMLLAIAYTVLSYFARKRDERPQYQSEPRVRRPHHITSL